MNPFTKTALVVAAITAAGGGVLVLDERRTAELALIESARIDAARENTLKLAVELQAKASARDDSAPCACSSGRDCEQFFQAIPEARRAARWGPAIAGNTIGPRQWRGPGCIRRLCVDVPGRHWPIECPGG